MIAVFSKSESDFKSIEVSPSKMFIRIREINDIRGRTFTGIIRIWRWWSTKDVEEAYDYLRMVQPELFD
jgi:hypothetical protein